MHVQFSEVCLYGAFALFVLLLVKTFGKPFYCWTCNRLGVDQKPIQGVEFTPDGGFKTVTKRRVCTECNSTLHESREVKKIPQ